MYLSSSSSSSPTTTTTTIDTRISTAISAVAPTTLYTYPFNSSTMHSVAQPINLMPAISYSNVPICSSSNVNTMMGSSSIVASQSQQQQQPVIFSGSTGNFFLAQSASVPMASPMVGNPSLVLTAAPGNQPNPGGFVVAAQPLAQTGSSNCIIRLPDGRFIMHPTPSGNAPALGMPQLPAGSQPTSYFPALSAAAPLSTPINPGSTLGQQAFYIQMPTNLPNSAFSTTQVQPASPCTNSPLAFANSPMTILPNPTSHVTNFNQNGHMTTHGLNSAGLLNRGMFIPAIGGASATSQSSIVQPKLNTANHNATQFANVVQPGMAVARLPNGTYTTVPLNAPPPGPLDQSSATTNFRSPSSTSTRYRGQQQPTDTADVLRRLNDQVGSLQRVRNPTDSQLNRLKQLIEVRTQLVKASVIGGGGGGGTTSGTSSLITPNSLPNSMAGQRFANPGGSVQISPVLRRDLLDTLAKHNLMPKPINGGPNPEEMFIVEFRLNQQRYQLRLTRTQKVDMERLLFSITSQRQAEILTVFQQEQSRLSALVDQTRFTTINPPLTPQPSPLIASSTAMNNSLIGFNMSSQSFCFQPTQPFQMHAFQRNPGLRLVAAGPRSVMPASQFVQGTMVRPGANSSAPVMGVVAMAMPPMSAPCPSNTNLFPVNSSSHMVCTTTVTTATSGSIEASASSSLSSGVANQNIIPNSAGLFTFPAFNSSSLVPQNSLMGSNFVLSQPTAVLNPNCCGFVSHPIHQPGGVPFSIAIPSVSTNSINTVVRPVGMTLEQATRITKLRQCLANDLKLVVERLPVIGEIKPDEQVTLPSNVELLESLAPYHVLYDMDNTDEAMTKVDAIFDEVSRSFEGCITHDGRKIADLQYADDAVCMAETEDLQNAVELSQKASEKYVDKILDNSFDILANRQREMQDMVNALLFKHCLYKLEPFNEDRLLLSAMALDLERDILKCELNSYTDVTKEPLQTPTPILNQPDSRLPQPPSIATSTVDVFSLTHQSSLLPKPWSSLLGPIAYLRPLTFDDQGRTTYAKIQLPDDPSTIAVPLESSSSSSVVVVVDDGTASSSSDEAEADRLLGLSLSRAAKSIDKHGPNGFADGLLMKADVTSGGPMEYDDDDEAYDFWQELMHEQGIIGMDEGGQEEGGPSTALLEHDLDGESMLLLHDEPPAKSLRLLDSGQSYITSSAAAPPTVQHSEDPDIDAAIRSILSTSD